ncbi:MAG: glycosyl transferase [Sulfurimonas sp.]|nr:MAG: glycosyl transferase [Sulfurimonas sp.]
MQISVIIPTYNRYEFLKRALKSVFTQTYQAKEIIVIDDGSTDKTSLIQKDFPKIKYFYKTKGGVSSARNLGIKKSSCEWIAFLDSDDEWHINKLELQSEFHKNNENVLISYTDERWIRDGNVVKVPKKYQKIGGDIFEECLSHCFIAPSATIVHKNLLDQVGLFDESLEVCEDYDLWLRVAAKNHIGLINEKLITKYGGANDQLSMKYWGMDRFRVKSLEKLLSLEISDKKLIKQTLVQKYKLLLSGAIKHKKGKEVKDYENKLRLFEG